MRPLQAHYTGRQVARMLEIGQETGSLQLHPPTADKRVREINDGAKPDTTVLEVLELTPEGDGYVWTAQ